MDSKLGFIIKVSCSLLAIMLMAYIVFNVNSILFLGAPSEPFDNDVCERIPTPSSGPEDIVKINSKYMITATGYISKLLLKVNHDQTNSTSISQSLIGQILLISTEIPHEKVIPLTIVDYPANSTFFGHGIYFSHNRSILYVINHSNEGEKLDAFKIDIDSLKAFFLKSFKFGDEFRGLFNDLIMLEDDDESFMLTTCKVYSEDTDSFKGLKKFYNSFIVGALNLQKTFVYSCSFKLQTCHKAIESYGTFNNGITWNKNILDPTIFVSDTLGKAIRLFKLAKAGNNTLFDLKQFDEISLDYMPDNIEFNKEDNLVQVAIMGKGIELLNLGSFIEKNGKLPEINDPDNYTFSGYAAVDVRTLEVSYFNFNRKIRGGSGVLLFNNSTQVYYGSWCDNAILRCDYSNIKK